MICPRESCPINARINTINEMIARESKELGFTFRAEMEFGEACSTCGQTRYWIRLEDGSIRERKLQSRQHIGNQEHRSVEG